MNKYVVKHNNNQLHKTGQPVAQINARYSSPATKRMKFNVWLGSNHIFAASLRRAATLFLTDSVSRQAEKISAWLGFFVGDDFYTTVCTISG